MAIITYIIIGVIIITLAITIVVSSHRVSSKSSRQYQKQLAVPCTRFAFFIIVINAYCQHGQHKNKLLLYINMNSSKELHDSSLSRR